MKDLLLASRRAIEALVNPQAAAVLFGTGFFWTLANKLLGWLLLGPALVVLFRICLKALRGEECDWRRDNRAVIEDLPAALVAGILLALPFKLWSTLDDLCTAVGDLLDVAHPGGSAVLRGIPATASTALFIHFAFHVFTFPVLSERHCGFLEASERSRRLADMPGKGGSRLRGLGLHLLFTSAVLLIVLGASATLWKDVMGGLFTCIVGPPAVMFLSAWYLQLTGSPARDQEPASPSAAESDD